MFNRREMLSRIMTCQELKVPITNYGVAIAYLHGILERAVAPLRRVHVLGRALDGTERR